MTMAEIWIARRITDVREHERGVTASVEAVLAVEAGELGGWLTGEPLAEQGIQALPNLPDLALPADRRRVLTLLVEFPAPEVVRLLITDQADTARDAGWLGIITDPQPDPVVARVEHGAASTTVCGSGVEVHIGHDPLSVSVTSTTANRTVLRTAERLRQATGLPMCPPVLLDDTGATLHLQLDGTEDITGFGEQFSRMVHNGKRLVLRCTDALGTATGYAYKPVPTWHSSAGYTALLNTGTTVTADVEHTRPSAMALRVTDYLLDLHVAVADSPKDRLSSYTALTGRAEVPPPWAFGYWLGRCRYHSSTEMLDVAREARRHDIPLDVLHCDPDWLITDKLNCDFRWNTERFGPRERFVSDLRELGVRLSIWEVPYLDPESPRYAEAAEAGHLVRDTEGAIAPMVGTPAPDDRGRALVDLASDAGRRWWQELHEPFLDDGVAVFKTDFAEGLPDNAVLGDGTPSEHAHNLYPLRYNSAVSDVIRQRTGRPPLVWARSGWAGSQRYPAQWGGDPESSVAGMRATLRGGLSFALSAPGLWSHDVGGFFGSDLTPELYVRWTQFGALSPLMRAHGLSAREPWAFGERVLSLARDWIRLRYSLLPYLWQVAHEAQRCGWPMLRPLALEFPDDPVAASVDAQYFLGSALLVAPVFEAGGEPVRQRCYLPEGAWIDLLTDEVRSGPGWHVLDVPLERMPVFVRAGTVLPRVDVANARNVDDLLTAPWVLHTYGEPSPGTLIGFDRDPIEIDIDGDTIRSRGRQPIASHRVRHEVG